MKFYPLLSLSLVVVTAATCGHRFGFEAEFAYIGGSLATNTFFDDTTADFEPELLSVLSVVVSAVAEYRGWQVNSSTTALNYTSSIHGEELPGKLELGWVDPRGRHFRVTQESVSGRLFDGVELVFPPSDDTQEVAAVLSAADRSPLLARAPDSGMHIWVEADCLGGRELIRLILDFEDHHANRLARRFQTPTDSDRSRFWQRYSDCNPNLVATLRKMSSRVRVSREAVRAAFLQHRPEEHRCVGVRGQVRSRLSRRIWRYKGLNVASLLNLSDTRVTAVEFRAWDFLRPNQVPAAIGEARALVRAAASPASPHPSRGVPIRGMGRWKGVTREEMLFQRALRGEDPKDPKYPRTDDTAVNSCVEVNIFPLHGGQRKRQYGEAPSAWMCEYLGDVCRPPHEETTAPTHSPTAAPTFSPTAEDCRQYSFSIGTHPRPLRERKCRAAGHCQWSKDGGGQCHTIADCLDFNVLGYEERRRYCRGRGGCRFHKSVCKFENQ